jgi:Poly(ADP-ribose) polymerase catalytic domain
MAFQAMQEDVSENYGDFVVEFSESSIAMFIPRDQFSEMKLAGMGWGAFEGDIHVKFCRLADVDSIPEVKLAHATEGLNSRVLGQLNRILTAWLGKEKQQWESYRPARKAQLMTRLYRELSQRLQTLPQHCIVCDARHEVAGQLWRPAPCDSPLCQLHARELSCDSLARIYSSRLEAELEISLFAAAAASEENRRHLLFTTHCSDFLLPGSDKPDWGKINAMLIKLPSLNKFPADPRGLPSFLEGSAPQLFNLVRYVLNISPGFVVEVRPVDLLKEAGGVRIFLFRPTKQTSLSVFEAKRSEPGVVSTFAFHGSRWGNWHSILREGLLVASGTPYMAFGQALGPGIYLASDSATSLPHSGSDGLWLGSTLSLCSRIMALCEILHTASETRPGGVFVVGDAQRVLVRALLVIHGGPLRLDACTLGSRLAALPEYRELHGLGPPSPQD